MRKHVLLAKMLMILTVTGFLSAFSSQSNAQCDLTFNISGNSGSVLDIDQNQNNTCMANFAQANLAQQFTAVSASSCGAGLTFVAAATGDLTIQLYDALPNAGGNLLASGTTTLTGQTEGDVAWASTPITVGVQYYLVFTSSNITTCIAGSTTNPYAGGILYANAGFEAFAGFDYTFRHFTCGAGGWGDGTTWTVTDASNNVVLSGGPYGNGYSDSQTIVGANNGPYTYTIVSAFPDNSPNYSVVSGVDVLFSGNVPGLATVNVGPINCPIAPPPSGCDLTFAINSASWGDGTTWTVTDASNNVVLSGGPYGNGYSDVQTLTNAGNGPYTWNIVSIFFDNSPSYTVSSGVDVLFTGTAPAAQTTVVGPINCPAPPSCDLTVNMSSPSWGDGTTWTLTDASNTVVLSGGPYGNGYSDSQTLTGATNAPYTLTIVSLFIDNSPNYAVSIDGNPEWTGTAPAAQTTTITDITCAGIVLPPPPSVSVPFSGSNTIACGTNTQLSDHAGPAANYTNNANGFTVIEAANDAVINIAGNYQVESNWDFIRIYDGTGTGGALLQTFTGSGAINFTGAPGQTLTLQFTSDASVVQSGFDLAITYTGNCSAAPVPLSVPASGSNTIACGTNTQLTDHAGAGNYSNNVNGFTVIQASNTAVINIAGNYQVESGWDNIRIYDGSGTGGALLQTFTGFGAINFTGAPGQTLTLQFTSDGSVTQSGFDLLVSYTGTCSAPPPPSGCDLTFAINSASWGDGTTWTVTDASNNVVLSGGPYANGYSDIQTLTNAGNGPYTWNIVSQFFDNSPNYTVSSGVDVLFTGTAPGFQTTSVGPINCPVPPPPPSCEIAVTMSSGSWGDGTTWTLTDASNNVVLSGGPYGNGYSDTQILAVADNGPYTLTINSQWTDNLPNYSVSVDGNVILTGTAPGAQTTTLTGITCSAVPPCQIDVDMSSASWGDLTTWTLTDANNNIVLSGGPYGNGYSDSQSVPSAADGPYTLTIVSTFADNSPNYVVSVGGNVVFSGTAPGNQTTTVGPIAPECSVPPTPCEAALPIACGDVVTGTTVGAPTDAVPTCITTNGTGGKIWYEFTGTGDVVTATTCSALTGYDTKLWVFSGDCNNLTCVTGNDDDFNCVNDIFSSTVEFVSTLGETYYIIVGGFGTSQGNYELSVTCAPVPVIPVCATNINVTTPPCGAGDISITWDAVVDADNYNIYAGTAPGLNDIANPFPLGNFTEVFLINPALNTTYYITVVPSNIAGEALGCVEFNFTSPSPCPPPANDDICDATDVTNSIQQDLNTYQFLSTMTCDNNIGNTDNGTPSPVGPSCGAANGNDVWYSFTTPNCAVAGAVPFTIELTTNNPGTAFDTKIALFISDDNTCTGNMTEVICNDDNAFGGNPALCGANPSFVVSAITINTLLPNTQYWVYVGGFNGSTGTYELSGRALAPAHGVAPAGGGTQVQLTTTDMGAALYTYYYKLVGSTGHSTFNSPSALTDTRTLAPGNDYITQVMYRCDANFFNQNQWYRTEPQTITLENQCALVNDMTCTFNGPNSYTLTWTEPSGDLFTNNGALSGYRIKRNPIGSASIFTFSNPAVVCSNGTCSVTLPGNNPAGFNWTIETRCSANTVQVGNTTSCGPAPSFEGNNDANNNIDRTSENVFSFVNAETGVEFVDVQMFDAYADFGLNTPMLGDYEMYVNSKNEITWRRVDAPSDFSFDFIIVPNPTNAMTTVFLNTIVESGSYTVIDAMGRTINTGSIDNTDNIDLDATQLQSGVYMVVVTVGNQQLTRRLVVAN